MPKSTLCLLAGSVAIAALLATAPAMAYTGQELAKTAKISLTKRVPSPYMPIPEKSPTKNWKKKKVAPACAIHST